MSSENADSILMRILERAAQNLTIEKLLIQLHLDPNNLTFDVVYRTLGELVLASITLPNMCALIGAILYAGTFLMQTIVPLRILGILSALFFMAYGILGGVIATFLMYFLLLPINSL